VLLSSVYPHYKAALDAPTPEQYVEAVSRTWSTDPGRAAVISIYHHYIDDLSSPAPLPTPLLFAGQREIST
jgi:hypothetical protein